jgi:hypothetical protein
MAPTQAVNAAHAAAVAGAAQLRLLITRRRRTLRINRMTINRHGRLRWEAD